MIVIFEILDEKGRTIGHSSSRTLTDDLASGQGSLGTHGVIKEIEVWEHAKDLPANVLKTIHDKKIEAFEEFLKTLPQETKDAAIKRLASL